MQAFTLIPPLFACPALLQPATMVASLEIIAQEDLDSVTKRLEAIELAVQLQIDHHWSKNNAEVVLEPTNAWGYLELLCHLTGRSERFLMPVVEGYTVQAINQNSLVGNYAHPLVRIITVRQIDEYHVADAKVFEDRAERNYSKEYSTLRLIQVADDGTVDVKHVFFEGKSRSDLIQAIQA